MSLATFYIMPEDVFRLGNADHSRLSHVRSRDVDCIQVNGIVVVVANNKGISVFDAEGIARSTMSGWVWKFSASTPLPQGLKLVHDKPHALLHRANSEYATRQVQGPA